MSDCYVGHMTADGLGYCSTHERSMNACWGRVEDAEKRAEDAEEAKASAYAAAKLCADERDSALEAVTSQKALADRLAEALADAERERDEARGEASVLVGCPCYCHVGWDEPHLDCRECVRGTVTPTAVDNDHEWALWFEKWAATVDTLASTSEKLLAARNEARVFEEQAIENWRIVQARESALAASQARERTLREALGVMLEISPVDEALSDVRAFSPTEREAVAFIRAALAESGEALAPQEKKT